MKKIPLTQDKFALVDDADYEELSSHKWFYGCRDYAGRSDNGKIIYMHRFLLNTPQGLQTDHINGNRIDNRKENLRICTRNQNIYNQRQRINSNSPYKGVRWHERLGKWGVRIQVNGKRKFLGLYLTVQEAALAYNKEAEKAHGIYACLNVIK